MPDVDPASGTGPAARVPQWRRVAERLREEALAPGAEGDAATDEVPDPADFGLADDCCLGGCCAEGTAYLEALERAAARRAALGRP